MWPLTFPLVRYAMVLFLAVIPYATLSAQSQGDSLKIITHSHMLGIGKTHVLDTYLSQEHFKGLGFSFLATTEHWRPSRRWSTLTEHEANFSVVNDRADSKKEIEGAYNLYWGRLRNWLLLDGNLRLQAGAVGNLSLGVIYNTANSNNPAQVSAHLNLMPIGAATYHFLLFGQQMSARYELALPLCGIMFSPNYGQSYYEIFSKGNYDHNVVPTTFVSAPEWRHMLTLDAAVSRKMTLRIGYLGNMQQAKVNSLRRHVYTHRLLIGITRRFSIVNAKL